MADYTLYYSQCKPASLQSCLMADCPMSSNRRSCVNHFSHNHPLRPIKVKAEEELICSGCGIDLSGSAFECNKSNCGFILHKSCFRLEPVLEHNSHTGHPLTLLSTPPKDYRNKRFICDACGDYGTRFDYHCSSCQFDLHVGCAFLPKTTKHVDHQHPLTLFYSSSCDGENDNVTFVCDVCDEVVRKKHWVYYCEKCDNVPTCFVQLMNAETSIISCYRLGIFYAKQHLNGCTPSFVFFHMFTTSTIRNTEKRKSDD